MDQPDITEFYRYVHARGAEDIFGLALKFRIDYKSQTVTVGYAICYGDKFDKRVGKQIVDQTFETRNYVFQYPQQGFGDQGILRYFLRELRKDRKNVPSQDVGKITWIVKMHYWD